MEIVSKNKYLVRVFISNMPSNEYSAILRAINDRNIVEQMFHINLAPILGRWKWKFVEDLCEGLNKEGKAQYKVRGSLINIG